MRIYKNDIIKASAISTDDDRGLLLCSITDSGRVVVSYYHYSRKDKNHMSSQTDYVWETKNEEMFKYFEARRTKVFYSQIRAMYRFYGKKHVRKYKKL